MTGKTETKTGGKKAPSREDRLKSALKANLARRKAQAKVRSQAGVGAQARSVTLEPEEQSGGKEE